MKEETEKAFNKAIKKEYEPLYKRKLTDEEVDEIRENLIKYFEWLIEVDARIKRDKTALAE